jgi:hypothetical protein
MRRVVCVAIFAVLVLAACDGGQAGQETPNPTATPAGSSARIVFTRDGAPWAIDADGSGLTLLAENSPFYVGSSGAGDTLPDMSSRRDKVAFIGSDKNLWVVDVEGHNLQRLSAEAAPYEEPFCPRTVLIAGWTPDDAEILYFVESGGESCTLPTDVALGFYIIDLESGAKTHLPELHNFVAWLDTERVIFEDRSSRHTEWYTFDTHTGEVQKLNKLPFECSDIQASLSYSDNTMVYACANPDEGSSIVHANIDNTGQTVLLEGRWAELQNPHVSPNGESFVFDREHPVGGGLYAHDLYRYDLASGGETLLMSGLTSFQEWLDDTRVVVLESGDSLLRAPSTLYVVDVITGDRTALAGDVDFY